jgi:hypothetical protein
MRQVADKAIASNLDLSQRTPVQRRKPGARERIAAHVDSTQREQTQRRRHSARHVARVAQNKFAQLRQLRQARTQSAVERDADDREHLNATRCVAQQSGGRRQLRTAVDRCLRHIRRHAQRGQHVVHQHGPVGCVDAHTVQHRRQQQKKNHRL